MQGCRYAIRIVLFYYLSSHDDKRWTRIKLHCCLFLGDLEQLLAQRGTLLQPGRTLKDHMTQGYVYIILVDTVTREYVEIAQKEHEEMKKKKFHARTLRNRAKRARNLMLACQ